MNVHACTGHEVDIGATLNVIDACQTTVTEANKKMAAKTAHVTQHRLGIGAKVS